VPATTIVFFQERPDQIPSLVEWLDSLPAKAQQKCLARLKRLEDMGHELRRPEADYLRDGIYELRESELSGSPIPDALILPRSGRNRHFARHREGA
jgi:hypothetical protein